MGMTKPWRWRVPVPEILTPYARTHLVSEIMGQGVELPQDLLTKAFRALDEALVAVETKFFSYKGIVRSQKEVPDHTTRLAAAKDVFTIAQLIQREKEAPSEEHYTAMEYDERAGVLRLISGTRPIGGTERQEFKVTHREYNKPTPGLPPGAALEALEALPPAPELSNMRDILLGDLHTEKSVISDEIVE